MTDRPSLANQPFAPSWLDWIVRGIERLPGPTWAAYFLLTGLALAYVALEAALSSRGLFGQDPAYFAYAIFQTLPLATYHLLSRGAISAWATFRPATDLDDDAASRWQAELSTTPARPAALLYVFGAALYLVMLAALQDGFDLVGHQPAFIVLRVLSEALWIAPLLWMVVYLLFRQARIVSHLHRTVTKIDLLQPAPLQAMATLTARSAIALLLLQLFVFVPLPNVSDSARLTMILLVMPFTLVPVAAFFLPLRGMRALLEKERARRQATVAARIDSTVDELHRVVDAETDPARPHDPDAVRLAQLRIDGLNKALASLLQERDFIGRLSTWPWNTATLRAVLSAIALPIVLFLLTRALERFVL